MRTFILSLLVLLTATCSIYIPVDREQKFIDCFWQDESLAEAIDVFSDEYASKFNLSDEDHNKLITALSEITVECREGDHVDFKWNGQDERAIAVTLSPTYVLMSVDKTMSIGRSSIFHELTHVALWNLQGSPDPDHLGEDYHGWTPEHEELIFLLRMRFLADLPSTEE